MPDLNFTIDGVEVREFAAAPTLLFKLRIENRQPEPVRSVMLQTQIRIVPNERHYGVDEQARLADLFGEPHRWGDTLKHFLWTHSVVLVPSFTGSTQIDLPLTCTYDFEVASAKYFHSLDKGDVPIECLFSGTVFYQGQAGALQAEQISWEKEARFLLPVRIWKEMMEHYFPNSAWLRVGKDTFALLYEYKVRHGWPTWEAALEDLLRTSREKVEP